MSTQINEQNSPLDDLALVDSHLASAASAIDDGDYNSANANFEQVIEISQKVLGANPELAEIKQKIQEIQNLLKQLAQQ